MNPDQLSEALREMIGVLNAVVQAIPGGADCTVQDLIEYLGLAKDNRLHLLAIHRTLESVKQTSRRQTA